METAAKNDGSSGGAALCPPLLGSSIVVTIHLLTLCEQTTTSQLPNVFDMALLNSSAATTFYGLKKSSIVLTYLVLAVHKGAEVY